PTLQGRFKVPHFDGKGSADQHFADAKVPTTYLLPAFYWENFIYFGRAPRRNEDGTYTLALPLGGTALPGIATEDIGRSALGILRKGVATVGKRIGISGENLTGEQMAAKMGRALGKPVHFHDGPFGQFRRLGFPGAEDLGNMFEYQHILDQEFVRSRDPQLTRELNPGTLDFDGWLAVNASRIPLS